MARSYPYGKVPSSVATVISERFERPMVDCGYCSGQMLARSARGGVSADGKKEGHGIRLRGGRPHWAGNNANELRRGLDLALGVKTIGVDKAGALLRVKQGFAVAVSLTYIRLPSYLKVQVNDFGHCILLKGYRSDGVLVGVFDPLWEQGTQGTWAKWADIDQALWDTGHTSSVAKYVPAGARYTVHLGKDATIRSYTVRSQNGVRCIATEKDGSYGVDTIWRRDPSHAPCTAPFRLATCDNQSQATCTVVTGGAFKDQTIKVDDDFGVTVSKDV